MDSSSSLFRKVTELGKFVYSSGILHSSWSKISVSNYRNQDSSALGFEIQEHGKLTIVVFTAPRFTDNDSALTILSGSQDQNPFWFLCSEKISEFSLHSRAFQVFSAAYKALSQLKSKLLVLLESKKPVIITGARLGGSVASLFTLWLLETINPKVKPPLCITFGSPLIGDSALQQILENSVRNLCFLHVADAAQTPTQVGFKPFGTFLICFDSECICVEDPEAVLELLTGVNADQVDYGDVLKRLDQSILSMADSRLMIDDVIDRMEERAEKKKLCFDSFKKLNHMKISLMYVEWYKKESKKFKIGYYDRFRTQTESPSSLSDMKIQGHKKELKGYWTSVVEEVEKMPQSDISILKRRFLYAGNNYRRLIEPLDIAEYYLNGGTKYRNTGRSRHYVMLEKWFGKESINPKRSGRSDLSDLLTFDSCFWAEVEEAKIVLNSLKTHEGMSDEISMRKLVEFEDYVWRLIDKREVSPEIFLEKSSFMKWWNEYEKIKESNGSSSSPSGFTEFMINKKYHTYGQPA